MGIKKLNILILCVFSWMWSSTVFANSAEAEGCIQTKTWTHYDSGWSLRTFSVNEIKNGEFESFSATFYGGREYLVEACGDSAAQNVDLVLFDRKGQQIARADGTSREPMLTYKPDQTTNLFIVTHLRSTSGADSSVALAILYR